MQIMSHQNRRQAAVFMQPANIFLQPESQQIIHRREWFIQQQDIWPSRQGSSQRQSHLHPARQFTGTLLTTDGCRPTCSRRFLQSASESWTDPGDLPSSSGRRRFPAAVLHGSNVGC